jgi:hypothetical protein
MTSSNSSSGSGSGSGVHEHDCPNCTYLGADGPQDYEPSVNQVDMYICGNSIIRRYSSEPSDYGCSQVHGLVAGPGRPYLRNLEAAKRQGVYIVKNSSDWANYYAWRFHDSR